jgi:hypothetical protein
MQAQSPDKELRCGYIVEWRWVVQQRLGSQGDARWRGGGAAKLGGLRGAGKGDLGLRTGAANAVLSGPRGAGNPGLGSLEMGGRVATWVSPPCSNSKATAQCRAWGSRRGSIWRTGSLSLSVLIAAIVSGHVSSSAMIVSQSSYFQLQLPPYRVQFKSLTSMVFKCFFLLFV